MKQITSAADLQAANPDLKKPKKGKMMVVPKVNTERMLGDMKSISLEDLRGHYEPRLAELYDQLVASKRNSEVNVGIVLPFQLQSRTVTPSRMAPTLLRKNAALSVPDVLSLFLPKKAVADGPLTLWMRTLPEMIPHF